MYIWFIYFFRCNLPLCHEKDQTIFRNKDELILHLAKEHKLLERHIHLINAADEDNEKVRDVFSEMIASHEVKPGVKMYYCKKCSVKFPNIRELRKHVVNHIKTSFPLPKTRPYVCPECHYEVHTYMYLFKHEGLNNYAKTKNKSPNTKPVDDSNIKKSKASFKFKMDNVTQRKIDEKFYSGTKYIQSLPWKVNLEPNIYGGEGKDVYFR